MLATALKPVVDLVLSNAVFARFFSCVCMPESVVAQITEFPAVLQFQTIRPASSTPESIVQTLQALAAKKSEGPVTRGKSMFSQLCPQE